MDKPNRTADEAHQDNNNRLEALTRLLDEFARTVAENNCRALIDVLKDVIREFNKKIRAIWRDFQVTEQSVWTIPRPAGTIPTANGRDERSTADHQPEYGTATERYQSGFPSWRERDRQRRLTLIQQQATTRCFDAPGNEHAEVCLRLLSFATVRVCDIVL